MWSMPKLNLSEYIRDNTFVSQPVTRSSVTQTTRSVITTTPPTSVIPTYSLSGKQIHTTIKLPTR